MKLVFSLIPLIASSLAAYVPSQPWSTLTPTATASCGVTSYSKSFGIALEQVTTEVNIKAKRGIVSQIGDGQIQATTGTEEETLITKKTKTTSSENATTETVEVTYTIHTSLTENGSPTLKTITVETTELIEKTSRTFSYSSVIATSTQPAVIVSQISDGQIQAPHQTADYITEKVTKTITLNGSTTEVEETTEKPTTKSTQTRTITSKSEASTSSASTLASASSSTACPTGSVAKVATCKTKTDLTLSIANGILVDGKGRIGAIVANRQFQFDGPPPQGGSIYAAGWSIVNGHLALGDDEIFWQCLSGGFYNIYDEYIAEQCTPVHLKVVDLVDC